MTEVHVALGVALLATNLATGAWGVIAWLTARPSIAFWYLLRAAQATVVAQATLGAVLLLAGRHAESDIHYVYGIVPLVVTIASEGMRVGAAQRVVGDVDYAALPEDEQRELAAAIFRAETRVMAVGALFIAAIAVRAATTSGGI